MKPSIRMPRIYSLNPRCDLTGSVHPYKNALCRRPDRTSLLREVPEGNVWAPDAGG